MQNVLRFLISNLKKLPTFLLFINLFFLSNVNAETQAQVTHQDPPRAGSPLPGLTSQQLSFFNAGKDAFLEVQSVSGDEPGAEDVGLGPRFNLNSCAGCHAQPAVGGSSPPVNPQIAVATRFGARNSIPFFISINGPVREARFKFNTDGTRDGGVKDLFVITGRRDARSCNIKQPDFDAARAANNIVFRIPTPLFGAGLIESIPDEIILDNKTNNGNQKKAMGIKGRENRTDTLLGQGGHANRSGNDGTITRFGWKAQNKSLEIFSGEAYNVEQGVTNELFQSERDDTAQCHFNPLPESHTNLDATNSMDVISDVTKFSIYMRFLAPPTPKPLTPEAQRGSRSFTSVGCALCHTPTLSTGPSPIAALSNKLVNLYSDLLLHSMGPGLADNIVQQFAGPDDFRTAPLWGLSQRLFFLHDGRTSDLTQAILAHASTNPNCMPGQDKTPDGISCKSEANAVIDKFNQLSDSEKSDLLQFLNSL